MRKLYILLVLIGLLFTKNINAQQAPTISSFISGLSIGYTTRIVGQAFTGTTSVSFGGFSASSFTVVNDTLITAELGVGGSGDVVVTTPAGTATASGFVYTSTLSVFLFSPQAGPVGSTINVGGNGFSLIPAENNVFFGTVQATVLASTRTNLTIIVPPGATVSTIRVQVGNFSVNTYSRFIVTEPGQEGTSVFAFEAAKPFLINHTLSAIATGDLEGDGKPDLVMISKDINVMTVMRNVSQVDTLDFAAGVNYSLPGRPQGICIGDIDNDGKADIVVTSVDQFKISVFRNTSTGNIISFAGAVEFIANANPFKVALGDIDGDGRKDIVVTSNANSFSIFRNTGTTGNISFASPTDIPTDDFMYSVAIEDFDGDNLPDIALGGYTDTRKGIVSVYRNVSTVGSIVLGIKADYVTDGTINSIISKDLDLDGKNDLAVVSPSALEARTFKNTSTAGVISFDQGVIRPTANLSNALGVADFDMDGNPDLAIPNYFIENSMALFRNLGVSGSNAFSYQQHFYGGYYPTDIAIADFTGDGQPDIATVGMSNPGYLYVTRNITHEPLIKSFTPASGPVGTMVTITGNNFLQTTGVTFGGSPADSFRIVNDNTIIAFVGAGTSGIVAVTNSYGTGKMVGFTIGVPPVITSVSPQSGPVGTVVTIKGENFSPLASGNIVYFGANKATVTNANDTLLTVLAPANSANIPISVTTSNRLTAYANMPFLSTLEGSTKLRKECFADRQDYGTGLNPWYIATGDVDGDGKTDLVVLDLAQNMVSVYRSISAEGAIDFAAKVDLKADANAYEVILADLDGDGRKDIIVASNGLVIHKNISTPGQLKFALVQQFIPGNSMNSVAVGDVNADGLPDLAVSYQDKNQAAVLRNTSAGGAISFTGVTNIPLLYRPNKLILNDFNQDGRADIGIIKYNENAILLYSSISTPDSIAFAPVLKLGTETPVYFLNAGDINGDKKTDIITREYPGNSFRVYQNITTTSIPAFADAVIIPVGFPMNNFELADLNGDSKLDLLFVGVFRDSIGVMENKSQAGTIDFYSIFNLGTTIGGNRHATTGDFDNDGKADIAIVTLNTKKVSVFRNKIGEALVIPSGANPVIGGMTNKVTIDPTVQTHQGRPYVQRHYDITPVNNPATATATITLYFTQQEFDNYNAHPAHGLDLPHHATDNLNKANLRVYQYHGFSATGQPGSYSGNGVEIDPDDLKIVWNATTLQWEVTFDVNGFSGFFLGSAGNSILPVTILSFTGKIRDEKTMLEWTTTAEINVAHFELQRRDNNGDFVTIAKIRPAGSGALEYNYQYTDALSEAAVYHYRLKIVDIDASATYSKVITIKPIAGNSVLTLKPNPARDFVMVKHPANNGPAQIRIVDMFGKTVKSVMVASQSTQTRIALNGLPKGTYTIVLEYGVSSTSQVLIIQ